VLLARALAMRPALLLLDEVTNGLDAAHRAWVLQYLDATSRSTLPWVLTTHRVEDVPRSATHLAVLHDGRIRSRGRLTPAALRRAYEAPHGDGVDGPPLPLRRRRRESASVSPDFAAVPAAPLLVGLRDADVYVDGERILGGLSLQIRAGECWVVHGGNGAGKTTLLRTIYGDHPVAAGGRIERAGIEPGVPLSEFRAWVGYVTPQLQTDQPQYQSVLDTVGSGLHASVGLNEPLSANERRRALAALADFGLRGFAKRNLRALSYGQLRRVLFARAWVSRPRLLLLDEPFAGVDAPTRATLLRAIERLHGAGLTVVMATHHRAEWPRATGHELELAAGRQRYCGPRRR
jgi:molybdate transport system ATP-binding protein